MKLPVSGIELPPDVFSGPDAAPGPVSAGEASPPIAVLARIDDPDPKRANEHARRAIDDGAAGLSLVFEGATTAFGGGLAAREETIGAVLDGIALEGLVLRMDPNPSSRNAAGWLLAHLASCKADPSRLKLSLGIDPAAVFARNGSLHMSIEALKASMPQSLAHLFAMGVPGVLLEADGRVFHNAGATPAQEIGAVLAIASGHLKLFEQARQALVYAAPHIGFALGVNPDNPEFVAKTEAVRLLWAQMLAARDIRPTPVVIHAEISSHLRDHPARRLACSAAAAGRANSLTAPPVEDSDAARRGAVEAASSASVARMTLDGRDFEALLERFCEAGRAEFLAIEREGGILDSLAAGHLQARIFAAAGRFAPGQPDQGDTTTCVPLEPL